jgi:hypothetical protein
VIQTLLTQLKAHVNPNYRIEIMFSLLYHYVGTLRTKQLQKLAVVAAEKGMSGSRLITAK